MNFFLFTPFLSFCSHFILYTRTAMGKCTVGNFFFGWCFVRARARALDMHVRRGVFGGDAAIVKSMWNVVSFWCFRGGILLPRPFILPWLRHIYIYIYIYTLQYCTIFKVLIILRLGFASVSCFFLSLLWSCCGVFCRRNNLWQSEATSKGGCPQDTQPPLFCFLLLLILRLNDDAHD